MVPQGLAESEGGVSQCVCSGMFPCVICKSSHEATVEMGTCCEHAVSSSSP